MKVLQYVGPEKLEIAEMPRPQIADDDVLLQITSVGICGTDLHIYHGGMEVPTPLVMGHEFVGTVVEVGRDVDDIQVGQLAVAEHVIGCGHCAFCLSGQKNLCPNPTTIGMQRPGALAEFLAVPASLVYVLPEGMSMDQGVLVEPLSIAVYAVRKAGVAIGQKVAVVGQGPIGLFVDQVAQAAGATVYGFDVQQPRLDFAEHQGYVERCYNVTDESGIKQFLAENPEGADVVFECVGRAQTIGLAVDLARSGGKVEVLGVFEEAVPVPMMSVVKRELTLEGSWTCLNAFPATIELLRSGKIKIDGLITHRYPFDKGAQAFVDASSYSDNRIKSVIEFT